ncbi:MAG: hypothetical protein Q8O91_07530 [Candidatus Aminicenantes bacterium]|nr:hypothetical protein [Candidatus Aminicenantes bacterium]
MSDHWKSIARLLIISALIAPLHAHLQNAAKPAIIHGPLLNEGGIDLAISGHYHRLFKFDPEPGKNAFPIIGGPQDAFIRADVTAISIDLKVIDIKGNTLETLTVPSKKK